MNDLIKKINNFPDYSPIKVYLSIISNCKLQNKNIISSRHVLNSINKLRCSAPKLFATLTKRNNILDKISIEKTGNSLAMLKSLKVIDLLEIQDENFAINILIDKNTASEFLNTINENLKRETEMIANNLPKTLEKGEINYELF